MTPESLGRRIYQILGIEPGDNIVVSRDKISPLNVLVSREVKK